ncbi:phage minor capsid protein [Lacrimispora sp.]|uniref:phage minor capsid protein n=1 Tax=Lacrimispora sp. TaxID=2719234 RepID=UPI00289B8923|nr:phage minor capsid protein [Lacrimispora sp.]
MRQKQELPSDSAYNLRKVFEEIELDLIKNLKRNLIHHEKEEEREGVRWEMWQKAKLRNLFKFRKENLDIVNNHSSEIKETVGSTLQGSFDKAKKALYRLISTAGKSLRLPVPVEKKELDTPAKPEESFFDINVDKVNAMQGTAKEAFRPEGEEKTLTGKDNDQKVADLKTQVTKDMQKVQGAVWRYMDDIYRQTIYKTGMYMAAGTKTLDQAIDMATKDFLNAGINCIEYKTGRRVNIASYAEMALRTASQRATFLAEGRLRDQWGIYTVVVSAHANTCSKCAPWQGKVLVDDVFSHGTAEEAKELGVPLLSEAMKAGLLHPNCRHTLTTYFPDITVLPAVPDEKKAKENYEAEQMQRAIERKIRKWKRIAEGAAQGATVKLANDKLFELHKMMKEHLEHHPELRRAPNREKTRGLTEESQGKAIEKEPGSGILKVDKVVSGHSGTPKAANPGSVIDHIDKSGKVDVRSIYGDKGLKDKDIHTTNHRNPKQHPYGENGEHAHDYYWNADQTLDRKVTRELSKTERKENGDIL